MFKLREKFESVLASGSTDNRRPLLGKGNESNVKGLYIIGDLAGAPVIKLAMAQGVEVIDYLTTLPEMKDHVGKHHDGELDDDKIIDVLLVGAGASGLNAALAAKEKGFTYLLLEKGKIANTIEDFPEGKWIYAEPDDSPPKGKLWLDGGRKEDLIRRWQEIIEENDLHVRTEEPLTGLEKQKDGTFIAKTAKGEYRVRKVVLATGQRGNPRKLKVPGEELEQVYHKLYSPKKYHDENILVVGGGNSAVEAALTLSEQNKVTMSYRSGEFSRLFKDNRRLIDEAVREGRIEVVFNSVVKEFRQGEVVLEIDSGGSQEEKTLPMEHAFVLVGAEVPIKFLKSLNIKLENDWEGSLIRSTALTLLTMIGLWLFGPLLAADYYADIAKPEAAGVDLSGISPWIGAILAVTSLGFLIRFAMKGDRWTYLGISFLIWYSVYGIKFGSGTEFWPYGGWGYDMLSVANRPWSFWYTVIYTALMTVFGIKALKRWGFDRRDKLQIARYVCLISFQWFFFFIVPEFLFQWAVQYQWVGETLASDPQFADQAWRSYGIIYAWPLFFYTWFYDPHQIWVVWGVILTFVVIPVFVLFHGKRYCSWICGCGGLAETFGDRWRHLAPKGKGAIKWEWMGSFVLIFAVLVTGAMLLKDSVALFTRPAETGVYLYKVFADVWLVGILPVTLYPFMGGKVWCRYWCPLAKIMQMKSKFFTKIGWSRFHIVANDKCIACNECSRNCQVGIDVMSYALKQQPLDNETSSCIGCGICVSVCPMDTLSYSKDGKSISLPVIEGAA